STFFVHFFFAALVSATAIVLRCELVEWCLLLGCIGLVLTAELFNSALETIYHGLDDDTRPSQSFPSPPGGSAPGHRAGEGASRSQARHCLDIAAGAVLLAGLTAALIGAIIFLPKLAAILVHLLG